MEEEPVDSDEELSLSQKRNVEKEHGSKRECRIGSPMMDVKHQPPYLYRLLYTRHHRIRLNWFKG
jgi:hypothetical protein